MSYRDTITTEMEKLAEDPKVIFIGYNLNFGSRGYKTLVNIPSDRIIEMPVAENLMTGIAMGLSIEGYKPVILFERHDFMLNAMDALINHLDKIKELSAGEFNPCVLVRAIVGGREGVNPGPQHEGEFTEAFKSMFKHVPVYDLKSSEDIKKVYGEVGDFSKSAILIEYRDLHKKEI